MTIITYLLRSFSINITFFIVELRNPCVLVKSMHVSDINGTERMIKGSAPSYNSWMKEHDSKTAHYY